MNKNITTLVINFVLIVVVTSLYENVWYTEGVSSHTPSELFTFLLFGSLFSEIIKIYYKLEKMEK